MTRISAGRLGRVAATAIAWARPQRRQSALAVAILLGLAGATIPTVAQSPGPNAEEISRRSAIMVATLVRTTLVALHQANLTGNYSVLRDLAAPGFGARHTAADLARIFAPIRSDNIDLDAVVVLDPRLTSAPVIDDNRMLRIEGRFETRPSPVGFQLLFQAVDDRWRLFGLSVNPIRQVAEAPPVELPDAGPLGPAILPQSLVPTPRPNPVHNSGGPAAPP